MKLTADRNNDQVRIKIESIKNIQHYKIFVLKGIAYYDGEISWQIIESYNNYGKRSFQKSIVDKKTDGDVILYRIMVLDRNDKIEYTPIISLNEFKSSRPDYGA